MNNEDYSEYRENYLFEKMDYLGYSPLDVMITGVTGAGKSTTLNAVFQKTVAEVGDGTDPETMELDYYSLSEWVRLWDTPGLGDGIQQDKEHSKKMISLLNKTFEIDGKSYGFIDLALVIIEGSNRDMGTTYHLINDVIVPNIQKDRILVAINQADMAMKGRHWDKDENMPDDVLESFLEEQAESIQRRVKEATGVTIKKPVYYSAEKKYNIGKFLDFIIDSIPDSRRQI